MQYLSYVIYYILYFLCSVICYILFVICYMSYAIRYMLYAICHMLYVIFIFVIYYMLNDNICYQLKGTPTTQGCPVQPLGRLYQSLCCVSCSFLELLLESLLYQLCITGPAPTVSTTLAAPTIRYASTAFSVASLTNGAAPEVTAALTVLPIRDAITVFSAASFAANL